MPEKVSVEKTVHVNNPQGTITEEAISAIKEALEKNEHTHIVVDGEEDLLTLIARFVRSRKLFCSLWATVFGHSCC